MSNQAKQKNTTFLVLVLLFLVAFLGTGCLVYLQKTNSNLKEKSQSLTKEHQRLNQTSDELANKISQLTSPKRLAVNYLNSRYMFVTDFRLDRTCLDSQTSIYSNACTPVFYFYKLKEPILKLNPDDPNTTIFVYRQKPSAIFIPHKIFNQKVNLGGKSFSIFQHQPNECLADCFPSTYLETKLDHGAWMLIKLGLLNVDLTNESNINKVIDTQINSSQMLKTLRFLDKSSVENDANLWPTFKWRNLEIPKPPEVEVEEQPNFSEYKLAVIPNFDINYTHNNFNQAETILFSYQGEIDSLSEREIIERLKANYNIKKIVNKQLLHIKNNKRSQLKALKLSVRTKQPFPFFNQKNTLETLYVLLDKKHNQVVLINNVPQVYKTTIEAMLKRID